MDNADIGALLIFYAMLALTIGVGIWVGSYTLRSRMRDLESRIDALDIKVDGAEMGMEGVYVAVDERLTHLEETSRAHESSSRGNGVLVSEVVKSVGSLRDEMALHASTLVQVAREIGLSDESYDEPEDDGVGEADEPEGTEGGIEDDGEVFTADEIFAEGDDTPRGEVPQIS